MAMPLVVGSVVSLSSMNMGGSVGKKWTGPLMANPTKPVRLSPREREVLRRRANGDKIEKIAADLGISVYTVKNYVKLVHLKLGTATLVEACRAMGWLEIPDA